MLTKLLKDTDPIETQQYIQHIHPLLQNSNLKREENNGSRMQPAYTSLEMCT